ncbi:CDP-glycerol glycerophosphotransferase family protein, partial [Isoptericola halotolerans]
MPRTSAPARHPFARARAGVANAILSLGARLKRTLRTTAGSGPPFDLPLTQMPQVPVVAYFADSPATIYQIKQWLPVFEQVAQRQPFLIVTRKMDTTRQLRGLTDLPVAYARTIDGVIALYDQVEVKTVVYVNNGMRNFQSLIYQSALHVHVNHGESDKVSMVSNQAKAYDRVVVAGQAAIERHRRALVNFDASRLAVCGRPQLDLDVAPTLHPDGSGRRTVLYAPTWSGENDANNYTSLDPYGVDIVRTLLAQDDVRVVYKPHPRVINNTDPGCGAAHEEILQLVQAANDDGGKHLLPFDADPLSVFEGVDLLVTDISSIGLDFLYLHPQTPVVLTDRRTDRAQLVSESP